MAKKTEVTEAEQVQEAAVAPENLADAETPEDIPLPEGAVGYVVRWPQGIYLREGPGQAYRCAAVLPDLTPVLGTDVSALLREDRGPRASMWLKVFTEDHGFGWVDGAYLERVDDAAE